MYDRLVYAQYNFSIINFNSILKEIEIDIINDLHVYGLLSEKLTPDVKRIIMHHIIFGICEFLLKLRQKEKVIIYYNTAQLESSTLLKYFDNSILLPCISRIIGIIKKYLPIKIFTSTVSFDYLVRILQKNDGRSVEIINRIRSFIDSVSLERYTFSKIKTFTKHKNLTFLNKKYFNQLKASQLILV
jgi:hypothetical protein